MEADKTKRKQRKLNKLGSVNPRCQICGESEITALSNLNLTSKQKKLLEKHHIAGGHNGGETITVCLNCHAKLSDDQLDWPDGLCSVGQTPEMKAVSFFTGMAELFAILSVWCEIHAKVLYDFVIKHQDKEDKQNEKTISVSD